MKLIKVCIAGTLAIVLVAVPLIQEVRAAMLATDLCDEVGGLIVTRPVPVDAPLTETNEALFDPRDPLLEALRNVATDVPVKAWPVETVTFTPCLESGLCLDTIYPGNPSYLDLSEGRSRALLINAALPDGSRRNCRPAADRRAAEIVDHFSKRGKRPSVCAATYADMQRAMIASQQIWTLANLNPWNGYLQVHAWRVLPLTGRSRASIGLSEIGVETYWQKLVTSLPYLMGIRDNYRRNRCSLIPKSHRGLTRDTYFMPGHNYPTGRYRNPGTR